MVKKLTSPQLYSSFKLRQPGCQRRRQMKLRSSNVPTSLVERAFLQNLKLKNLVWRTLSGDSWIAYKFLPGTFKKKKDKAEVLTIDEFDRRTDLRKFRGKNTPKRAESCVALDGHSLPELGGCKHFYVTIRDHLVASSKRLIPFSHQNRLHPLRASAVLSNFLAICMYRIWPAPTYR